MTSIGKQKGHRPELKAAASSRRLWLPTLGLRVSERKLLLALVDISLLVLSLIIAVRLRTELQMDLVAIVLNSKWYVTLAIVWAIMAMVFDVYHLARSAAVSSILWTISVAVFVTCVIYLAIPWLTPPLENRSYGFVFVIVAVVLVFLWRLLYALLFVQPAFYRKALVVGAGASGRALVNVLKQADDRESPNPFSGTGHVIVGYIDDNPQLLGIEFEGIPVLGNSSKLVDLVQSLEIDEVVIAISNTNDIQKELFEAILTCREQGLPIVSMPTIYERLTGRVAVEHASRNIEIAAGLPDNPFFRMYGIAKRLIDLTGAILGLCLLALVMPMIALANLISSPGPLFFRQCRVGRQGKLFELIKFRSMVPDAEKDIGAVWASEDDKRVTPMGRLMRTTHLDEIPQVINVLKGEMSFVGPRPERPEFVEELSKSIPFYRVRLAVRPGLTGWAQIHQDYGDTYVGAKDKLEYDLYYLKRAGPRIDTAILLRTVTKVLGLQGR